MGGEEKASEAMERKHTSLGGCTGIPKYRGLKVLGDATGVGKAGTEVVLCERQAGFGGYFVVMKSLEVIDGNASSKFISDPEVVMCLGIAEFGGALVEFKGFVE